MYVFQSQKICRIINLIKNAISVHFISLTPSLLYRSNFQKIHSASHVQDGQEATHHDEYERDLLLLLFLQVFFVEVVVAARGRREEGGEEDHLGELSDGVDEAGRHALPEGAVLGQAEVLQS